MSYSEKELTVKIDPYLSDNYTHQDLQKLLEGENVFIDWGCWNGLIIVNFETKKEAIDFRDLCEQSRWRVVV